MSNTTVPAAAEGLPKFSQNGSFLRNLVSNGNKVQSCFPQLRRVIESLGAGFSRTKTERASEPDIVEEPKETTMNQHVAPNTIAPTSVIATADSADPLLAAIADYHAGNAAYSGSAEFESLADEDAANEATYGPADRKLRTWDRPATTREGALAALRVAQQEANEYSCSDVLNSMINASLAYLEQEERPAVAARHFSAAGVASAVEAIASEHTADAMAYADAVERQTRLEAWPDWSADDIIWQSAAADADAARKKARASFERLISAPCHSFEDVRAKAKVMLFSEKVAGYDLDPEEASKVLLTLTGVLS